jgi:anti-anti-sigma factor
MMDADRLEVALEGASALVRVSGRGSFRSAPAMQRFVTNALEKGCRRLSVDLGECCAIDSTFMGVLAAIAMRLSKTPEGRVILVNVGQRNQTALCTLGLDSVLTIVPLNATGPAALDSALSPLEAPAADRQTTSRTMLDAHEALVELSPANLPKFQDVLAYLRQERCAQSDGSSPSTLADSPPAGA